MGVRGALRRGFGAITPALAALFAELYGPTSYGSISGVMALVLSLARASVPVGASLLYVAGGGYGPVLMVALAACVLSGVAVVRAGGVPPDLRAEEVEHSAAAFGVELREHVQFVIEAMRGIAGELGM